MTTAHWFLLAFALYLAAGICAFAKAGIQRNLPFVLLAAGLACSVIPTAFTTR